MERRKLFPPRGQLCLRIATALFLTGSVCLAQDNNAQPPRNNSNQESNNNIPGYPGFGKAGWLGVFDVGPVIKLKGGYYTKPEIRFFATYAIWSDSLKGMATPIEEGTGGGGGFAAPYKGNTNHGWLFGTQFEWFF
jgi:hypothetical protein